MKGSGNTEKSLEKKNYTNEQIIPQLKKQQILESRQFWSEKAQRISAMLPSEGHKMRQLLKVTLWCSTCPVC